MKVLIVSNEGLVLETIAYADYVSRVFSEYADLAVNDEEHPYLFHVASDDMTDDVRNQMDRYFCEDEEPCLP